MSVVDFIIAALLTAFFAARTILKIKRISKKPENPDDCKGCCAFCPHCRRF